MVLPSSGQISFNDLRVELGVSSQAPFSIASASAGTYATINTNSPVYPDAAAPHLISEWYSYNHTAAACTALNSSNNLQYSTSTPGSPGTCDGSQYPNSRVFYSTDCSTLGAGCTIYFSSPCSVGNLAYGQGVLYITDGSNYYILDASSVTSLGGGCGS